MARQGVLRRAVLIIAVVILVSAAVAGAWLAARPPPTTLESRTVEITSGLRCPSCQGQSVAASEGDLARQMRQVTREQLAAGRTPEQIRAWFADRYGEAVLLDPAATGSGLLVVLLPFGLLAAGAVVVARLIPGRRGILIGAGLAISIAAVLFATGGLRLRPGSSDSWSPPSAAVSPLTGTSTRNQAALAALRAGRAEQAVENARAGLAAAAPDSREWQDALLLLGLAQRQAKNPAATATLQRFLSSAPNHPAAPAVHRLLAGG